MIKNKILLFGCCLVLATACKKNESPAPPDGRSALVADLPGDTLASMSDTPGRELRDFYPMLYSFRDGSHHLLRSATDTAAWLGGDWDIAFTGPYNSEVVLHDGKAAMLDQPYGQVAAAPAEAAFGISKIGWANNAYAPGWYFYSLDNHICVPIKNRTYVLRLRDGKYAKLELLNIYKGNPPVVTDLFWPSPYLTFRYYVQPDGSKNLKTQ